VSLSQKQFNVVLEGILLAFVCMCAWRQLRLTHNSVKWLIIGFFHVVIFYPSSLSI